MTGQLCRVSEPRIRHRSDEDALFVHRQFAHVLCEAAEHAVLKQILFDIRSVERGNRESTLPQIIADSDERFLSRKVSDDRNNQVLAVQVAYKLVVLLDREKISEPSVLIGLDDQFFQTRKPTASRPFHPIRDFQPVIVKILVNVLKATLISFGQLYLKVIF